MKARHLAGQECKQESRTLDWRVDAAKSFASYNITRMADAAKNTPLEEVRRRYEDLQAENKTLKAENVELRKSTTIEFVHDQQSRVRVLTERIEKLEGLLREAQAQLKQRRDDDENCIQIRPDKRRRICIQEIDNAVVIKLT